MDKLDNWQSRKAPLQKWADGEKVLFRGETFILRVIASRFKTPPQLTPTDLIIHVPDSNNQITVKKSILQWYKQEAMRVFGECVEHFAPMMGVVPRELKLTSARTQWGNCNTQGVVRLNWQLVTMPLPLIDYVVVHELAHLREMNHSPAFWRVVESACPDYVQVRRELRTWNPVVDDEI